MAVQSATLADFLASSECTVITILLGLTLTLVVLYALALFIKTIGKSRAPSDAPTALILCQNCAILHGRREQEPAKSLAKSLASYEYSSSSSGYQKCSACAARFKHKAGSGKGSTFYGKNLIEATVGPSRTLSGNSTVLTIDYSIATNNKRAPDIVGECDHIDCELAAGECETSARKLANDLRSFIIKSRLEDERPRRRSDDERNSDYTSSLQTVYEVPILRQEPQEEGDHKQVNQVGKSESKDEEAQATEGERGVRVQMESVCAAKEKSSANVNRDPISKESELNATGAVKVSSQKEGQKEEEEATNCEKRQKVNWRKLLQASRVVSLLDQLAQKRDRALVPRAFQNSMLAAGSSFAASGNRSRVHYEPDEPEFIKPRKLRSAEIQINQQHQIIFGKSKDSILVPDWFSSSRNGSSKGKGSEQEHKQTEAESEKRAQSCASERGSLDSASTGVTTRVLTDEKGHSIKVRIASPPPQRQIQLVKQMQQQHQSDQQQRWISGPRDSSASDCPLVSLPSLIWDENIGLEPDPEVAPLRPPRGSSALGRHHSKVDDGHVSQHKKSTVNSMSPGTSKRRRHSAFSSTASGRGLAAAAALAAAEAAEAQAERNSDQHDETSGEFEATAPGPTLATNTTSGAPIETFNDSNTSEFDDVPGCDSRQDTSVDYLGHLNGAGGDGATTNGASPNSNEQVMDADLRQMNRLNLQLALLQSAGQQTMRPGAELAASGQLVRHGSISSPKSQHHHHQHLPQSGVLAPAGSGPLQPEVGAGSQRASAPRRQSSEDADSGCMLQDAALAPAAGDESRRSSGCLSGGERRLSSSSSTPTWQVAGAVASQCPVASVRIRVRKVSPSGAPLANQLDQVAADGRKSLLSSLANTIGRSRSTDSPSNGHSSGQDLYEISLLEARNVNKQQQASDQVQTAMPGSEGATLRARRDSFLGALMAATGAQRGAGNSPGAQRRSSVEGIFARIFKQQQPQLPSSEPTASWPAYKSHTLGGHAERLPPVSSSSSCNGAGEQRTASESAAHIQLPLLKLSPGQASQELVSFEQLAGRQGYKFTCKLSEFPVRLSLYQISKRNGARLTLGHCILTPADWLSSSANDNQQRHFWPQVGKFLAQKPVAAAFGSPPQQKGAFETIEEQELPSSGSSSFEFEAATGSGQSAGENAREHEWTLEYCLHQTILEAIKAA